MSKAARQRWGHVDSGELAEVIFLQVGRRYQCLEESHPESRDMVTRICRGIVGRCSIHDRYFFHVAYKYNLRGVKDILLQMCGEDRSASIVERQGQTYCYCKNNSRDEYMDFLHCDQCGNWLHCFCVNEKVEKYLNDPNPWTCPFCKGGKVPRLFMDSSFTGSSMHTFHRKPTHRDVHDSNLLPPQMDSMSAAPNGTDVGDIVVEIVQIGSDPSAGADLVGGSVYATHLTPDESEVDGLNDGRNELSHSSSGEAIGIERSKKSVFDGMLKSMAGANNKIPETVDELWRPTLQKTRIPTTPPPLSADTTIGSPLHKSTPKHNKLSPSVGADRLANANQGSATFATSGVMMVSPEDWEKIKPQRGNGKSAGCEWRMAPRLWSDTLSDYFREYVNGECCLAFQKHKCYAETDTRKHMWARANCNRNLCTMSYDFTANRAPEEGQPCQIVVRGEGKMKHKATDKAMRRLAGDKRQEAVKQLKTLQPSKYLHIRYADPSLNLSSVVRGNLTVPQTLSKLRHCREESLRQQDLAPEQMRDLELCELLWREDPSLKGKHMAGYIQVLSRTPFIVAFYNVNQIRALREMLKVYPGLTLHIDATGRIVTKLPHRKEGRRIFLYTIVIGVDGDKDCPTTPVWEVLTDSHTYENISYVLKKFMRDYRDETGVTAPAFGVQRLETDLSLSIISASLITWEQGHLWEYLRKVWFILAEGDRKKQIPFVLHVCRAHVIRFLFKNIKKHYKGRKNCEHVLHEWVYGFVGGKDLHSFVRRCKDILILAGTKNYTSKVQKVEANIKNDTPRDGRKPWLKVNMDDMPETTLLKLRSPYGFYAYEYARTHGIDMNFRQDVDEDKAINNWWKNKCNKPLNGDNIGATEVSSQDEDTCSSPDDEDCEDGRINPFYCRKFLRYILVSILPLSPLLDHELLWHNGHDSKHDVNSSVENWFRQLKHTLHEKQLPKSCPRFLRAHKPLIEGRINMFLGGIARKKSKKRDIKKAIKNPAGVASAPPNPAPPKPKNTKGVYSKASAHDFGKFSAHSDKDDSDRAEDVAKTRRAFKADKGQDDGHSPIRKKGRRTARNGSPEQSSHPHRVDESWSRHAPYDAVKTVPPRDTFPDLFQLAWGGTVIVDGQKRKVKNSCCFDCGIELSYSMFVMNKEVRDFLLNHRASGNNVAKYLIKMFTYLDEGHGDMAKTICVTKLMRFPQNVDPKTKIPLQTPLQTGDFYGNEELFINCLSSLFPVVEIQNCPIEGCSSKLHDRYEIGHGRVVYPSADFAWELLRPSQLQFILNRGRRLPCFGKINGEECKQRNVQSTFTFGHFGSPPLIAYCLPMATGNAPPKEDSIPEWQNILGIKYNLFGYTLYHGGHFTSIVRHDEQWYEYDGLMPGKVKARKYEVQNRKIVSSIYLVRDE